MRLGVRLGNLWQWRGTHRDVGGSVTDHFGDIGGFKRRLALGFLPLIEDPLIATVKKPDSWDIVQLVEQRSRASIHVFNTPFTVHHKYSMQRPTRSVTARCDHKSTHSHTVQNSSVISHPPTSVSWKDQVARKVARGPTPHGTCQPGGARSR